MDAFRVDTPNAGRYVTRIPFGLNPTGDIRADTEAEAFSFELRDVNGAPILSLVLDLESGDYVLSTSAIRLADWHHYKWVCDRNRERSRAAS